MIEEARIVIAICMFAVAAFFDIKERRIHDVVWLAFGGTGAILYAVELPGILDIVSMTVGVVLASTFWFFRLYAGADALALIAVSVILPTYNGFIIPLSMVVISTAISIIYGVIYNIAANSRTLLLHNKKIFEEFDEPTYRKFAAFFLIHKKSKKEKFVFPAERIVSGRRKFRFRYDPDDDFSKDETYVSLAMPLTLFFLIGLAGLILTIISPEFISLSTNQLDPQLLKPNWNDSTSP